MHILPVMSLAIQPHAEHIGLVWAGAVGSAEIGSVVRTPVVAPAYESLLAVVER